MSPGEKKEKRKKGKIVRFLSFNIPNFSSILILKQQKETLNVNTSQKDEISFYAIISLFSIKVIIVYYRGFCTL